MTDDLTTLERDVIATILTPEHPVMRALRGQFERCHVVSRKATGVGFNTKLHVPSQIQPAPVTPGRMDLGDVTATIDGLAHGAGFVLFVQDGLLDALEGFSFDEPWPDLSARHHVSPGGVSHGHGSLTDAEQVDAAWDRSGDIGTRRLITASRRQTDRQP